MFRSDSVQDKKFSQCSLFLWRLGHLLDVFSVSLHSNQIIPPTWLQCYLHHKQPIAVFLVSLQCEDFITLFCVSVWCDDLTASSVFFFYRVTTSTHFAVWLLDYSILCFSALWLDGHSVISLQGDHLIAQCVYNSEERSTITLGGLTTREEMCLVFALYYPRIDMSLCHSLPSLPTVLHSLGIQELWLWVSKYAFLFWRNSPQWVRASTFTRFLDHTQRRTTVDRTPLEERSAFAETSTWQHTIHTTDIHAPSGFRNYNLSGRTAAGLRLRQRGHWDRPKYALHSVKLFTYPNAVLLWSLYSHFCMICYPACIFRLFSSSKMAHINNV